MEGNCSLKDLIIQKKNIQIRENIDNQMKEGKINATEIYLAMTHFDIETT
jgi:hypothetical protein